MPAWLRQPLVHALLAYAAILLLIRPWGEYPLNDDWQYAWITREYARTGVFKVDLPVAPLIFVQAFLARWLTAVVGFSHVALRCLTLVTGGIFLLLLDSLLRLFKTHDSVRRAALLLVVCSPFFINLSCSFMTEIYGYTLTLGGTLAWLWGRTRPEAGWRWELGYGLGTGLLFVAAFWTRQLCLLSFAPLWASSLGLSLWHRHGPRRRAVAAPVPWTALGSSAAVAVVGAYAYFPWAASTGSLRVEAARPLERLKSLEVSNVGHALCLLGIYCAYLGLPLLLQPRAWRGLKKNLGWVVGLAGATLVGRQILHTGGRPWGTPRTPIFDSFPNLGNVLNPNGLGAQTLIDRFFPQAVSTPPYGGYWTLLSCIMLVAAPVGLAQICKDGRGALRSPGARQEAVLAFLLLAPGMMLVVTTAFWPFIFDRYLLSSLLAMLLAWALTAPAQPSLHPAPLALGLALIAYYTVAGMHDYLRWNDARWDLFAQAKQAGAGNLDVDGGFELNGWMLAESGTVPAEQNQGLYRTPRRFIITQSPLQGFAVAKQTVIDAWLVPMPPLQLRERGP